MSLELLQTGSEDDMRKLEAAWKEAQQAGGVLHPMYTWEWMRTWWEVFGEGRSLVASIVRKAGQVVAIAPFVRRKARVDRLFCFRRMEFMGTGEEERDEVFSEYIDLPARPGIEWQAVESLADELLDLNGEDGWDDVVLHRVRPDSIAYKAFRKRAKERGLSVCHLSSKKCPYVTLPPTLEEYDRQLSHNRRKRIRRGIRSLEKMGEVRFEKAETVDHALASLDILAELHQVRWRAKGKHGVFASDKFTEFHRRFIRRTFALGWPELWTLRVDGKPIACRYNIRYQGKISCYIGGIKLVEDDRVQPGFLSHYFAIKAAIESGAREYDFMLGEQAYKVSMSNASRELVTLRISRNGVKERLRRAVSFLAGTAGAVVPGRRGGRAS